MKNLGKGYRNYHLVITAEERDMIVNALAFFHAIYDKRRQDPTEEITSTWKDVADDTSLERMDRLATSIATIQ